MKHHLIALLPLAAFAQEMTGPTLGWSASEDGRSLHAIYGVAGAARLGPAIAWPDELTEISLSPSGQRAVALENGVPVLIDLVTRQRTALPGATTADRKIWSPLGTALLLANRETGEVRTYSLRGAAFALLAELTLVADSYSISDDGASLLAVAGDDLVLRGAGGASVLGRKTSAYTFLARTNVPVFTDARDLVIGTSRFPLPFEVNTLESPAAGRILGLDRANGKLIWFDDQGSPLQEASCNCVIERVAALGGAGTIRLVTKGDGPAWLAETSTQSNRLFFVPNAEPKFEVEQ